jgi:hypothetical protein
MMNCVEYARHLDSLEKWPQPTGDGGFIVRRKFSLLIRVMKSGNTWRGHRRVIHRHRFRKQRKADIERRGSMLRGISPLQKTR